MSNFIHEWLPVLLNALQITSFVIVMMLLIEYLNIRTKGKFFINIKDKSWKSVLAGSLLGILPGCMGSFFVVSLYTHGEITIGALLANFIATTGDESFAMLGMMPLKTLLIFGLLFILSLIAGIVLDKITKNYTFTSEKKHLVIHQHDYEDIKSSTIKENLKHLSLSRALLLFLLILFFIIILLPNTEHTNHTETFSPEIILNYLLGIVSVLMIYPILKLPDHFIEEHLWGHIIKKHFPRLFFWILVGLIGVNLIDQYVNIGTWIHNNVYLTILIAIIIGLIPASGPHFIFISMYLSGIVPISVLLASSITQDGHAGLPLLAESWKTFLLIKGIKVVIAFTIAVLAQLLLGWV